MEKEKFESLTPEEVKKFEEENMTDTQREKSEEREEINDEILDLKEEFCKFFGEDGDGDGWGLLRESNKDHEGKPFFLSNEEEKRVRERIRKIREGIEDDLCRLAEQNKAEEYSYIDGRTKCFIFSNGIVFCYGPGKSGFFPRWYFKDKEDLMSDIEKDKIGLMSDMKRRARDDEEKTKKKFEERNDFIKRIQ